MRTHFIKKLIIFKSEKPVKPVIDIEREFHILGP